MTSCATSLVQAIWLRSNPPKRLRRLPPERCRSRRHFSGEDVNMPPKKRADQNIMNQTASSIPADLIAALHSAKHVMVFTGAGVSAESGIPTFRDSLTGLWEQFDAGDLASPNAFRKDLHPVWFHHFTAE